MAVEGPLFALSTTAVLLRFYVRVFMLKTFGWDGMWPYCSPNRILLTYRQQIS